MRKLITSIIVISIILSCTSIRTGPPVNQKLHNTENGLVAVDVPVEMLQPDRTATADPKSLIERMQHYAVPGVSIAVIDDYKISWTKAYGFTGLGSEDSVTTTTLFEAASTTKLIGSVIALDLYEQGKLDLDEDVNQYLQTWKVPENSYTREHPVTVRLLLTHQAGLNRPDGGFDQQAGSVPSLTQVLNGESPALNQAASVEYVPGTQWQYSNFGYLVLQKLVEDITGKPYARFASASMFGTVGMDHSYLAAVPEDASRALPHDPDGNPVDRPQHPTALAQGGLLTTPTDLGKFAVELMCACKGTPRRVLSRKTMGLMCTVERELDPAALGGISGQGLGVFLVGSGENQYFLYAGFNEPGSTSLIVANTSTGKGAVIMTNGAAGLPLSFEIIAALAREYGWPSVASSTS
jgi:CubicO group peptidase (beta-lactamase class C family)